jgi:transcriptional accessory protein Tex/SPT6
MIILLDYIIEELQQPFKDPREYRTPTKLNITNHDLFYMLIDESERNFKRGIIVTATVTRVQESVVFCKLDNGLDATIQKNDLEKTDEKLQDMIQTGHVITGRIHEIKDKDENRFGVSLNCKKKDLEKHTNYVDPKEVFPDDLINIAFQTDRRV